MIVHNVIVKSVCVNDSFSNTSVYTASVYIYFLIYFLHHLTAILENCNIFSVTQKTFSSLTRLVTYIYIEIMGGPPRRVIVIRIYIHREPPVVGPSPLRNALPDCDPKRRVVGGWLLLLAVFRHG